MQRITHIRYSFLDLPKAITTSVFCVSIIPLSLKFTVMDLTVLSDFPMCCAISFCVAFGFLEVVKYGYLFQSAV